MGIQSFFGHVGDFLGITGNGSNSPGGGIPGLWDRYKNGQTNQYNLQQTEETNATNKAIAEQNLAFQRENLDYQKALQEKIFQREDSSYARTVQDMRQAGLSPLAMNGTNGAGEAIATSPLHNDYQRQNFQMQNAGGVFDFVSSLLNLANTREDVASKKLANKFAEDTLDSRIDSQKIETRIKQCEEAIKSYEQSDKFRRNLYNNFYNIHEGMSIDERNNAIINRLFNDNSDIGDLDYIDKAFPTYAKDLRSKTKSYSAIKAGSGILDILKGLF